MTEKNKTKPLSETEGAPPARRDRVLVESLREGNQRTFLELFRDWHPSMIRVALNFVRSRSVAEEVAQETWLHFMQQLERFKGRSSLKTWTFRILVNRAISRGKRDQKATSLLRDAAATTTSPRRPNRKLCRGADAVADSTWASGGAAPRTPEERLLSAETRARFEEAIRDLPKKQKLVLTLRDIQGWRSEEVCELLDISPENQRVILHRARVRVRGALAEHLGRGG